MPAVSNKLLDKLTIKQIRFAFLLLIFVSLSLVFGSAVAAFQSVKVDGLPAFAANAPEENIRKGLLGTVEVQVKDSFWNRFMRVNQAIYIDPRLELVDVWVVDRVLGAVHAEGFGLAEYRPRPLTSESGLVGGNKILMLHLQPATDLSEFLDGDVRPEIRVEVAFFGFSRSVVSK